MVLHEKIWYKLFYKKMMLIMLFFYNQLYTHDHTDMFIIIVLIRKPYIFVYISTPQTKDGCYDAFNHNSPVHAPNIYELDT